MNKKKKKYEAPMFELKKISFNEDVLSDSQPGGGNWGYYDEDPTNPVETDDGFIW